MKQICTDRRMTGTLRLKAAVFSAALFLIAPLDVARAQSQTDQSIDFAVDAFTYFGKLGGVDIGEAGKALIKGAAKCVANNRPVLECARNELINQMPAQARPVAQCLLNDIGNIDKNIGKCALQAAAPLLSSQLPPEVAGCLANNPADIGKCAITAVAPQIAQHLPPDVQNCLKANFGDMARCAGDAAIKAALDKALPSLPPELRNCINTNPGEIAKCAAGALAPQIANQLPPEVQQCLKANLHDVAKCGADAAIKAAVDRAMQNVPPEARQMAECVAKVSNLPQCAGINEQMKDALRAAEKLKTDVNTATNILKVAEGIANDKWDQVLIHGGPEVYKAAAKIVLNAILTPALAPLIGPAVDLIVDNYTELGIGMINAIKNKDEALAIKIFAEFIMNEQVRPLCTVISVIPGSDKDKACEAIRDAIKALGDMGYAIFTCEALKKGDVPIIADIYQLGCGAATDAADIIWNTAGNIINTAGKGAGAIGGALGDAAKGVGGFVEDRFKDIGNAADAITNCKFGGILKDACDELGNAIQTGGDIANGVIKTPERVVEAFGDLFGGPDKRKGNNAQCAGYAQRSVDQAKRNQAQACGFGGNAWGDNWQGHYNWCLTVRYTTVNKEARVRDEWLNKCAFCQGYQKTTEAQIQNAKDRGCIDQMRAGAANRWGDGTGHYTWCMSGGPRGPTNEIGARNRDIANCRPTAPKPGTMPIIPPGSNITILCNDGRPPVPGQACPTPPPVNSHKRCPGFDRWFHTNEPCPAVPAQAVQPQQPQAQGGIRIQCWDGSISDGFRPCPPRPQAPPSHVRCPDGSWTHPGQACPQPRPAQPQMKQCPGGQVVPINANCPNQTKTCPGGAVVPITAQCPPQQPQMKTCPGGQQVPVNANCPNQTKTCPGGAVVPITAQCPPQQPQTKRCPNGQVVPVNSACPAPAPKPAPKCRTVTERDCGGIRRPGDPPPVCRDVRKTVCDDGGRPPVVR